MNNEFPFLFSLNTGRNQGILVIESCQHLAWALTLAMLNQYRVNLCQLERITEKKKIGEMPSLSHCIWDYTGMKTKTVTCP